MKLNSQQLAEILLGLRLVATVLIGAAFAVQIRNIRTKVTDYPAVRWSILILTLVLLVGQIIPIMLDSAVTFTSADIGRKSPNLLGAGYAINNAIKDVIIGFLLCFLYFRPGADRRLKKRRI